MFDQIIVFLVILVTLALFVHGRWRYDLVAMLALITIAVIGIIPPERAFLGFGHPAVITVAAVLVISHALKKSGLVTLITGHLSRLGDHPHRHMVGLTSLVAISSAFMNNVGALALLMPSAIGLARKYGRSPSYLLMPLAFGSLLGGMTTLIGTPPNVIIAKSREEFGTTPFFMFDFTPVGIGAVITGLLFIWLFGWRLIPRREDPDAQEPPFAVKDYLTEVRLPEHSPFAGRCVGDVYGSLDIDIKILGIVRGSRRFSEPSDSETLRANDILIVGADAQSLHTLVNSTGFEMAARHTPEAEPLESGHFSLFEAVVMPNSPLIGNTAASVKLAHHFGLNLLAVARQGHRLKRRLSKTRLKAGDVLLLHGDKELMVNNLEPLGCLPLSERTMEPMSLYRMILAIGIFSTAIVIAALELSPIALTFVGAIVVMVLTGLINLREIYENIDWPVIILLGALIPLGEALERVGGAQLIAEGLLWVGGEMPILLSLAGLMMFTMLLSNIVNNAAAAVLLAPIAVSLSNGMGVSADPFLMVVAIGASAPFLTPIGHQSNLLVMSPGGYHFADYWRMGLPLSLIIVLTTVPLTVWVWPLGG